MTDKHLNFDLETAIKVTLYVYESGWVGIFVYVYICVRI